ncbi:MAG: hypothetical protein MJ162_07780 [Treponema sp.]|nr:hypothetical protein [Treponema sp.]
MKFVVLDKDSALAKEKTAQLSKKTLSNEYKLSKKIGIIHLGSQHFFFKKFLKVFYIPYTEITRAYRRVYVINAPTKQNGGKINIETLVICSADRELADISIPGRKAADELMDILKEKCPAADFTRPEKK